MKTHHAAQLTVRLPQDLAEGLDLLAAHETARTGLPVTPSALVRRALARELAAAAPVELHAGALQPSGDELPPGPAGLNFTA